MRERVGESVRRGERGCGCERVREEVGESEKSGVRGR